jgi:glycosyltransferase involved in cell wall biosynthesis
MLTSSFPGAPADETCGYVRDFARAISSEFDVRVLAPADGKAREWPEDSFSLARSTPWLPGRFDPFRATVDFNDLLSESLRVKVASAISLAAFFNGAIKQALHADAICSHWLAPSGVIGASLSLITGKPHVAIEHSGALHMLARMRGGVSLTRFIARGSHRIVTVSEDLRGKLISMCPEAAAKVEVIPMGTGATAMRSARPTPPRGLSDASASRQADRMRTVLFVGRLSKIKGVDVLVRAMEGIENARLIVAGDGEQRRELEELARGVSVSASFLGRVGAVERDDLLSSCDAVVIPSLVMPCGRTEGTPVVCFEAMAAGRPVIAARVGGLAEIIIDGEDGLLFDAGDHLSLRERLRLVLDDASLWRRLSRMGLQKATNYHWSKIGGRFCRVIKESLKKNDSTTCDETVKTSTGLT